MSTPVFPKDETLFVGWNSQPRYEDPGQDRRRKLFQALYTRVLTPAEMQEALDEGERLNIWTGESYNSSEKLTELMQAFYMQHKIRQLYIAGAQIPAKENGT